MTPEQLTERLKAAAPNQLRAVILYGSSAAGDHAGKRSDYNILVVLDKMGLDELKAFFEPSKAWMKAGNPPPLLFTPERLARSADVFPIEILDIKDSHRVLYGEDVVATISVDSRNLRHQLEYELKAKLIRLREHYLATTGKPKLVAELLVSSLSSFLVLLRAALRLHEEQTPATKMQAARQLSRYMSFDVGVFETIEALKTGAKQQRDVDLESLFARYLATIEAIVDSVDAYLCRQ